MLAIALNLLVPLLPQPLTAEVRAKLQLVAFQAARDGDTGTLREYFAAGFAVNDKNKRGDTLLTVAAYNGQPKAVERILKQPRVAVDARNGMGLTALAAAAFKGNAAIAAQLLTAKADPNAANGSQQTALMFAALAGKVEVAKLLLAAGADPKATDAKGHTPLSLAKTQGAADVVKLLDGAAK